MATRSTISIRNTDGTIEQVYSHWDGYPANNGFILLVYYQDEIKIRKLLNQGDISSLREEVDIPLGKTHTFDKSLDNVSVFYHRDRGDDLEPSLKFDNLIDFSRDGNFQEFDYVYDVSKKSWFLYRPDLGATEEAFISLVEVVNKDYENMQSEYKEIFDVYLKKPYEEAFKTLTNELNVNNSVGVPKKPKKPLGADHPQLSLDGMIPEVQGQPTKKMKI